MKSVQVGQEWEIPTKRDPRLVRILAVGERRVLVTELEQHSFRLVPRETFESSQSRRVA